MYISLFLDKVPAPTTTDNCKACVNVTLPRAGVYPFHTQFTQGCSYDVETKLGCQPVDDNGTMCICDSELCNGDGKPYPTNAPPQIRAQRLELNKSH